MKSEPVDQINPPDHTASDETQTAPILLDLLDFEERTSAECQRYREFACTPKGKAQLEKVGKLDRAMIIHQCFGTQHLYEHACKGPFTSNSASTTPQSHDCNSKRPLQTIFQAMGNAILDVHSEAILPDGHPHGTVYNDNLQTICKFDRHLF